MKALLGVVGVSLLMLLRGLLLWIVLPASLLAWALSIAPLLLVRLLGGRPRRMSPAHFLRWGRQFLDAALSRTVARGRVAVVPWPWREYDERTIGYLEAV